MQKRKSSGTDRYKQTIRRRRIFVASVFALVILLCICLFTPLFAISEITVSGNSIVSSETIIANSGIARGENVFRINKSKAEKALGEISYVNGITIKRKFPAKVEIVVDEAKPDIILDMPNEFAVMTVEGKVLEVTDDVTHLSSPIVYGIEVVVAEPSKMVETTDYDGLMTHLERIRCFYGTEHWENIDEFFVNDVSNFMVVLKSGMKVTFGTVESTESLKRKIKMLSSILPQVEQTERSYLDLTTDKGYFGKYTQDELAEIEEQEKAAKSVYQEKKPSDGENPEKNTQADEEGDSRKKPALEEKESAKEESGNEEPEKQGSNEENGQSEKQESEKQKSDAENTPEITVSNPGAGE